MGHQQETGGSSKKECLECFNESVPTLTVTTRAGNNAGLFFVLRINLRKTINAIRTIMCPVRPKAKPQLLTAIVMHMGDNNVLFKCGCSILYVVMTQKGRILHNGSKLSCSSLSVLKYPKCHLSLHRTATHSFNASLREYNVTFQCRTRRFRADIDFPFSLLFEVRVGKQSPTLKDHL